MHGLGLWRQVPHMTTRGMCAINCSSTEDLPKLFDVRLQSLLSIMLSANACHTGIQRMAQTTDQCTLGHVMWHSLEEASCAPLDLAAAAFAGLGSLLAQSDVSPIMLMYASSHHAVCTQHEYSAYARLMCRDNFHCR